MVNNSQVILAIIYWMLITFVYNYALRVSRSQISTSEELTFIVCKYEKKQIARRYMASRLSDVQYFSSAMNAKSVRYNSEILGSQYLHSSRGISYAYSLPVDLNLMFLTLGLLFPGEMGFAFGQAQDIRSRK